MNEVLTIEPRQEVDRHRELFDFRLRVEAEYRERVGGTFERFINHVQPGYPKHRHIQQMVAALERVIAKQLTHVMFLLPQQYYKSTTVSRLFPAAYLFRHPEETVGLASYSGDLAHMMSRAAMDFYVRSGMPLHPDVQATKEWMTASNGGMWSAGIGGSIGGRSLDVAIIDDMFKDEREAYSKRIRELRLDWYRSIWIGRRPKVEILVNTRWHEGDLVGWLFEQERVSPKFWHVFLFDAVRESAPFIVPTTCVLEEDWRLPGEALCSDIHTGEQLAAMRKTAGELFWSSIWQQRPVMTKGNKWQAEWFLQNTFDDLPEGTTNLGCDWDTAQTDDESNAANAFVKSCRKDGVMYVTDLGFEWFEFPQLISWMKQMDGPHYVENKSSGKDVVATLKKEGIAAFEVGVKGDKESRTDLVLHHAEAGRVKVARHLVDKLLNDGKQGILAFPRGKWRDLNDVLVQAMNRQLGHPHGLSFVGA